MLETRLRFEISQAVRLLLVCETHGIVAGNFNTNLLIWLSLDDKGMSIVITILRRGRVLAKIDVRQRDPLFILSFSCSDLIVFQAVVQKSNIRSKLLSFFTSYIEKGPEMAKDWVGIPLDLLHN